MRDQQKPLIFVVDDEQVIAETLALILGNGGFSAKFFVNPLEALQAAQACPPDLVISDVMMPQMSGVDLAIKLRAHCPHCKILLFSGNAGTADLLHSAREQGYSFNLLAKPVHPLKLLQKIRSEVRWPTPPFHSLPLHIAK
jgi:CheY-like chemotaxis protein